MRQDPVNPKRGAASCSPYERPPQRPVPERHSDFSGSGRQPGPHRPEPHRSGPAGAYPPRPASESSRPHLQRQQSPRRPRSENPRPARWNGHELPPRDHFSTERVEQPPASAQSALRDEERPWPWYEKLAFVLLLVALALVLGKHARDVYRYGARDYFIERLGREDVPPEILREAEEKERDFDPSKVPGYERTAGLRSPETPGAGETPVGNSDVDQESGANATGADLRQPEATLEDFGSDLIPAELTSESVVVWDVFDSKILYAKSAEEVLDPASISKVMTSLLAMEAFEDKLDQTIVFQPEDFDGLLESGASMAGFLEGEEARVRDVLYGALVPSGAEACNALARSVGGSVEAFVKMMNQRADALGMENTRFYTPSGLVTEDGQASQSTALDLLKLSLEALRLEDFQAIAGTHMWTTKANSWHPEGLTFISTFTWKFNSDSEHVAEILAGKSGFTGEAQNLMSYGRVGGREYVVVTLGARTTDGSEALAVHDHVQIYRDLRSYRGEN